MPSAHSERYSMSEQEGLTIVLFGKTGNGKSSVGNIILGLGQGQGQGRGAREHFPVSSGLASATLDTETRRTTRNGKPIEVIDIPDFTNLHGSSDVIKGDIISVKTEVASKPYVILLSVRCDVRYTKEEYDIYKAFRDLWGRDISNHLIVAFTFGDRQERDLGEELGTVNPELKSVLKDAAGRYVVFDDTVDGNDKENQAERLMATIMELQRKAGVQEANWCCRFINCIIHFFQRIFYMVCCCGWYPCCGCRPCCDCFENCRRACRGDSCRACCRDSCCDCCRDSCCDCCRDSSCDCCRDSCCDCCWDSCCDCWRDSCYDCWRDSCHSCCRDSCRPT